MTSPWAILSRQWTIVARTTFTTLGDDDDTKMRERRRGAEMVYNIMCHHHPLLYDPKYRQNAQSLE